MSPDAATEFASAVPFAFKMDTNSSVNITMTLANGTKILDRNDGGDGDIVAMFYGNAIADSIFRRPPLM